MTQSDLMPEADIIEAARRSALGVTVHGPEDFAGMRKAGRLAAEVLDLMVPEVKPGATTEALDKLAYTYVMDHGAIPACVGYRGYRLWECPPNGQGVVPLLMAKALEGFNLASWPHDSAERYHVMAEVGRQAFADRDCFIGDPRADTVPVTELISERRAEKIRARVSFDSRLADL